MGRYGEIWGDMGRYGEIWGDVGTRGAQCGEARGWDGREVLQQARARLVGQ